MLCYKVKTNKLKTKTITDKANFRTFFQGEDEIELNLDNKLFIVTGKKYNVFFYYDYEKNEIYKLSDLKFSHFFGNMIYCELNSSLYCLGGINSKKCEMYRNDEIVFTNIALDKKVTQKVWETLPDLNVSRHECSSIFYNNFLYVFFGYNNLTNFNNNTIERMNIMKHENWEILSYTNPSYLNVTLNSHSIIKYNDNELLILGGFDGKHYRDSIFIFNVKTNSFHQTNLKIPDLKKNTYYYFFKESSFVKITEYDNVVDNSLPNYVLFDSNNRLHILNSRKFNYQIVNSIE
jgi:N-acetylneuraminic acid mutarotase